MVECVAREAWRNAGGVRPGDRITAINGEAFADPIDYRFLISDTVARLDLVRDGQPRSVQIHKEVDQGLGITFTQGVFDGIRRSATPASSLPSPDAQGMRKSLYIPDDDYRLGDPGQLRHAHQRHRGGSPAYLAAAPEPALHLRARHGSGSARASSACAGNAEVLPLMRRLADAGIEMHCQIVLCPSFNDGGSRSNPRKPGRAAPGGPSPSRSCRSDSRAIVSD